MKQRTTIKTQLACPAGRPTQPAKEIVMNDSFFIRKSIIGSDVKINKQISTLQKSPIRKSMKKINDHSSNSLIPIDNSLPIAIGITIHFSSFIKKFLHKTGIFSIALTILFAAASMIANAANRYSVANGNWNATSTWSATSGGASGASVPGASDVVFIEGSHTVTMTAAASCTSLSIASGSALNTQNFQLTGNAAGTFTMASGASLQIGIIDCSTAAPAFPTNFTQANITLDNASNVTYGGGSGTQVISLVPLSYGNLSFQGCAAKTIAAGTLNINGSWGEGTNVTFSGTTTVNLKGSFSNAATLTLASTTFNIGGDFTNTNVFNAGASTVVFNGTGSQSFGGNSTTFNNVQINKPSGTVSLSVNETAATLKLGSTGVASGTWGGTGSGATHINPTYFAAAPGKLTVTTGTCPAFTATISGTNTICNGSSSNLVVTMSGGNSPYTVVYSGGTVNNYTSGSNISVSPTSNTTYTLTSVTDANGCTATLSGSPTVTVTPINTAGAASSSPTLCINTLLNPNITHTTTGATGISNDGISGANGLPTGVSAHWATNQITISGTPTASGTFSYSILLTGGCGSVNATGTITVTPGNTITLSSAGGTDAQNKCINTAITNITYTTTGATGANFSSLPAGVTGAWAANVVTISGTPTASGSFNYTVTLTGGCGTITASGTITVNPLPTASATKTDISCFGANNGTIVVSGSGGSGTYSFFSINNGGSYQTSNIFSPLPAGVYQIRVKDNNGCESKQVQ